MAAEYIVAGRRSLPAGAAPWEFELRGASGTVLVYEASACYDPAGAEAVRVHVGRIVGWPPTTVVFLSKAWELARGVAEELARALDGVVYSDGNDRVVYEAAGAAAPVVTRDELERSLIRVFARRRETDEWAFP